MEFDNRSKLMKIIKFLILIVISIGLSTVQAEDLPNPNEDNLANFHLKDETCADQCHVGEEPSDDLEFEYKSCVECHGVMSELEGRQHNIKHQDGESMECVECHLPHEEFDAKEICTDCHDQEDEELKDFYSMRTDRLISLFFQNDIAEAEIKW